MSTPISKEEILRANASIPKPQIEGTHAAMDEYSRQTAIGFAEWVMKNYLPDGDVEYYDKKDFNSDSPDVAYFTMPQLYDLYLIHLQSLNK